MKLQNEMNLKLLEATKHNQLNRVKQLVNDWGATSLNCAYHHSKNELIKEFLLNKLISKGGKANV